jgi:DNA-binding NtrC family response regulator
MGLVSTEERPSLNPFAAANQFSQMPQQLLGDPTASPLGQDGISCQLGLDCVPGAGKDPTERILGVPKGDPHGVPVQRQRILSNLTAWPFAHGAAGGPSAGTEQPMIATTPCLLIVDDDQDTCSNLSDIFTDVGYRVETAYDGCSALHKMRDMRFEVAVLDLMMPNMDGLSLYREMKKLSPEIVVVLSTAYPGDPQAEGSQAAGIWRIVPKPVDIALLLKLIDEALKQPLVLVVDDDSEQCANLWDLLRDHGFRVGIAHDVRTATDLLRENAFDVVLIDMRLPDGDGADVFRSIPQLEPRARTILITGYRAETAATLESLMKEGVDAICYKPLDIADLFAKLQRLIGP